MISTHVLADIFAAGLLLATFLMMGKIRLIPMLRYFAVASLCLAGLGAVSTVLRGEPDYIPALATILFKVILVPLVVYYTVKKIPSANQLRMYFRPATTYILFALILVISGLIVRNLPISFQGQTEEGFFFSSLLFISVALILVGILLTIVRKDLFSQMLGILTMENGMAAFGLVALEGMPLFLEMGVFFVIIISSLIFANLIDKVHKMYRGGDTTNLNELID